MNGIRETNFFSCFSKKSGGYEVICEPEAIQNKKINKPVLKNTTFYLEDDNHEEVNFIRETLTFRYK